MTILGSLTDRGALCAGIAECLYRLRALNPTMPNKYQYPVTNTALQNEGLALINLSEEMIAYFAGTLGTGGGGGSVPTSITVLPNLPSLTSLNATLQFTAVVKDQNGVTLTPGVNGCPALVWSSSNTTSATVDPNTGIATETGNGTTVITATCGAHGGGTTLTTSGAVTPVPTTVTISPSSASLTAAGATQQFTATVLDQNSNPMTPGSGGVPALVWSSTNTGAATINSASGLATEVNNGSTTIKCVCGSASNTASLTCSGVPQTGTPTTVTVSPQGASLTSVGATQQYTAVVLDQARNVLTPGVNGCPALVWSSSNNGAATVNSSTGLATEQGNGQTTITATCTPASGGAALQCSGAPSLSPGNNLPSGMTAVIATGPMFPPSSISSVGAQWTTGGSVPTTISNFSPASPSQVSGEWCGYLTPTPSTSGLRVTYGSTLHGGNSPVRFGFSSFASQGTGFLYVAFKFRMASTWSFSTALGIKVFEPHTVVSGNNHVIGLTASGVNGQTTPTGNAFPQFLLQGTVFGDLPGGNSANGLPPSFTAPASVFANPSTCNLLGSGQIGNWNVIEFYIQPESPTGTSSNNGQLSIWINNTLQWTSVGHNDGTAGQTGINFNSGGYVQLLCDPTYGGDSDSDRPPAGVFWDLDNLYVAVK